MLRILRNYFFITFCVVMVTLPGYCIGETIDGPEQPIRKTYFGMHCFYCKASLRWPGEVDSSLPTGVGSWRLWDAYGSVWLILEPKKGEWDFRYLDNYVAQGQAAGIDLMLTLGQTPTWASSRPNEMAGGGAGAAAEPADIRDWKTYITKVATRYQGKISNYEIWNEPALANIERTVGSNSKAGYYSGTAEKLVELERVAAETIHEIDPLAKIVTPSFSGHEQGLKRLDAYLKAGGGRYSDVIGFHFYQTDRVSPEDLPSFVRRVKEITSRYGLSDKPIWNTESGLIIQPNGMTVKPLESNSKGALGVVWSENDAAALISRYLILGAAGGLERFYWFAWDSGSMGLATFMGFGKGRLINSAGQAFVRTSQWLSGAKVKQCDTSADHVSVCKIDREGTPQWLVWSASKPVNWTFPQSFLVSRYVTLDGAVIAWTGSVLVGAKPVLLIGR